MCFWKLNSELATNFRMFVHNAHIRVYVETNRVKHCVVSHVCVHWFMCAADTDMHVEYLRPRALHEYTNNPRTRVV